jgi:hypothetical protein
VHVLTIGGRKQRSAIDAVLLLLNNIQSKNNRKKARQRIATTLFLDVKGAFDHVSKNQLLSICKELGLPTAFTQWVDTFLSNRKLQLSFNGQTQEQVELETGIPQGSPISPMLFLLYIRNICSIQTEGAYSLSYIDDFAITVTSNSAKSNCKKLERIALEIMSKANEAAISFNVSKTELIHFHSKRTTIEEGLKLGDVEISPKPLVR